jgi:hypothetical protein
MIAGVAGALPVEADCPVDFFGAGDWEDFDGAPVAVGGVCAGACCADEFPTTITPAANTIVARVKTCFRMQLFSHRSGNSANRRIPWQALTHQQ